MKIYYIEHVDGLATAMANNVIPYCSAATLGKPQSIDLPKLTSILSKGQNNGQIDLHYIDTLLVSTGWNLNEDVFDPLEVWAARYSPEDKQFNFGHNEEDIIGHITGSKVVVGDLPDVKLYIGESTPEKFHLTASVVLYKYWSNPTLLERMDKIIAEIPEGKWFVSMEALFDDFDYAVITPEGKKYIVPRDSASAYLTKHLRAYGGTGKYKDYSVGRLLRQITFRGSGLVEHPANPNSIIFNDTKSFYGVKSSIETVFNSKEKEEMSQVQPMELRTVENKELQTAQAELVKANEEIKKLTKEVAESGTKQLKDEVAGLTKVVAEAKEQVQGLDKQLTAAKSELEAKDKKLSEAEKTIATLQDEIAKVKLEVKTAARVNTLIGVGLTEDEAKKKVASLVEVSDAIFAMFVDMIPKAKADEKVDEIEEAEADIDVDDAEAEVDEVDEDDDAQLGVDETEGEAEEVAEFNKSVAAFLLDEESDKE